MERLDEAVARVLAGLRVKLDEKEKARTGAKPSPGRLPRDAQGGTTLAGERKRIRLEAAE